MLSRYLPLQRFRVNNFRNSIRNKIRRHYSMHTDANRFKLPLTHRSKALKPRSPLARTWILTSRAIATLCLLVLPRPKSMPVVNSFPEYRPGSYTTNQCCEKSSQSKVSCIQNRRYIPRLSMTKGLHETWFLFHITAPA